MAVTVDVRCPINPSRLFMKIRTDPTIRIVPGNLVEVACRDCSRRYEERVLHRFNLLGEHVETVHG